ncbi:hypothetical protein MKZ38_005347 [Zalerion maritima]|uniref:ATP-dependent RNA helicase n=1 Tax=Zalerion maritima TaxID=339359 RepID=A0AAD5WWM8_9PEZI|nr:hypothetical protein MKZ38_005347 [Zalerion maritima]
MADDGMLINFEVGDATAKAPPPKFKGGKWRDRVRANKTLRNGNKPPLPLSRCDEPERPAKRPRLDSSPRIQHNNPHHEASRFGSMAVRHGKPPSLGGMNINSNANPRGSGVTSRLFTANPEAKTDFANVALAEGGDDEEPTKPSNAPLSEEAANFHALGLSKRIALHLSSKLEMKAPTAIQKSTIPQLVKEDADAFLQAETGSGKTLAYLLPIVQRIMTLSFNEEGMAREGRKIHRDSGLFAVILAPTRELCKQIATVLDKLLRCCPWIVSTTVIGGESKKSEKARIRKGVNILIATPGRLADHLDHTKVLDVGTVRWLVLDEGDRLMEMGFEDELRSIVGKMRRHRLASRNKEGLELDKLPQRRVIVLCSATMQMNVQKLGEISLEEAVHLTAPRSSSNNAQQGEEQAKIEDGKAVFSAPAQLKQTYVVAPAKLRLVTLISFLKDAFARKGSVMKAIIFISCADSVDFHFDLLKGQPQASPPNEDDQGKPSKLSPTAMTTASAAYLTSPANPSVALIKLHGSLAQPVRTATLHAFAHSKYPAVLITTDIASRGLDVPAVDLVIEYDPAFAVPDHVHRIGRTARAGRPGKAALFLLPGTEEGYVSLLEPSDSSNATSNSITPLYYETVLKNGLATPVTSYPITTTAVEDEAEGRGQSWTQRAESLQLHLEQRLLAEGNNPLLDAARQAFRSHIRAYATHVKAEREFFDMTQLHLGHMAKAFGLREAPGGVGGGVTRRTGVHHKPSSSVASGGKKRKNGASGGMDASGDDRNPTAAAADDAARRMREKMKAVMNVASEFNIG